RGRSTAPTSSPSRPTRCTGSGTPRASSTSTRFASRSGPSAIASGDPLAGPMRVHVALTPADFAGLLLDGRAALVVDVLRATTTVVAACAAGCARIVPVSDRDSALTTAARYPAGEVLLDGERGGRTIVGFPLGNSPLEYVAERVAGRTVVFTTTNGTDAMLHAGRATVAATAALVNAGAAARWAIDQERDLTVLCAGERRAFSLEDAVCAGIVVERILAEHGSVDLTDAALTALRPGEHQ